MAVYGTGYVRTTQGILKLSELLVSFIGLLLVAIDTASTDLIRACMAGFIIGLIVACVLFLLHISKIGSSFNAILSFQIYFNILWFIYMLIVSAVLISKNYNDQYMAGGGFGIIATVLYLVDAIDCFRLDPAPLFCLRT